MLHIDNLNEFLKLMIDNEESGIYFPQNNEFVNTSELVKIISEVHGKKIKLVKLFNPIILVLKNKISVLNKVFGDLTYEKKISCYKSVYQIRNLYNSIKETEEVKKG